MAPNPGGPPIWTGLSIEDIKELIKFSSGELCRCYAQKAKESLHKFRYNPKLEAEIKAWEQAHDIHWSWLKAKTDASPKTRATS